jgi:hypothetical protein
MSTPEEVRELPPDPVEIITKLQISVEELVAASDRLRQEPSDENIQFVYDRASNVKGAAIPIYTEKFFHASENNLLIGSSVEVLINSGNDLYERSRSIAGEGVELSRFTEDVSETLSDSFATKDMSAFGAVSSKTDEALSDEVVFETMLGAVIEQVDEHFSTIVDQYVDVVLSDEKVQAYIGQRQQELEVFIIKAAERADKIEKIKLMAGVMTAAFVGTALANKINSR